MRNAVIQLARRALPLMCATHRHEAERIIARFEQENVQRSTSNAQRPAPEFDALRDRAAAAWEKDLQPVGSAIAAALHGGDLAALSGLRALLPGLLRETARATALAGVLTEALALAFYTALHAGEPEETTTANAVTFSDEPAVTAAMELHRSREIVPTDFGSAELRGLDRQFKLRAVFSARTTSADYLQEVAQTVDEMLAGKINLATGRLQLLRKLKQLGYDPATGFPGDLALIPPAERGSLQDLSSQTRLDLMLRTLVAQARNFSRATAGNTEAARFAFPAWELVRLGVRDTPRGFRRVQHQLVPDPPDAWQRRWAAAGESVLWEGAQENAMVARKDSPVWQALGDGVGGFTDTLGQPFPPFAFNSGMDWRAVPRAECVERGVIEAAAAPAPMRAQLAPGDREIQSALARLGPDFKSALLRELAEEAAA